MKEDAKRKVSGSLIPTNGDFNQTRSQAKRKKRPTRRRRFSSTEKRDLSIATILVALVGVSLLGRPSGIFRALDLIVNQYLPSGLWWLLVGIVAIFVSTFIVHELAHKFVAQYYGMWSEFRMFQTGYFLSAMAILFSIPIFGTGVVYTSGAKNLEEEGKSNLAGPFSNFLMALIILGAVLLAELAVGVGPYVLILATYGIEINAFIGLFNMIPIQPFDGATVRSWSTSVWIFMTALLVLVLLLAYFFVPLIPSLM